MNGEYKSRRLTLDSIRPYLRNVKQVGNEIHCGCPLCEAQDAKPHHLYVTNRNGELLMYCQHCNAPFADLARAFHDMGATPNNEIESAPATLIEDYPHEYKNPDGSLAYCKQRRKWSNGKKQFSFYYYENGKQIFTKPPNCNVLYNLDLLEKASQYDEKPRLYICEGEKNADILTDAGLLATTSNTGAQKKIKFTYVDLEMLSRFPDKVVLNDNDFKGVEYVETWQNLGADWLPITELWPEAPAKADIYDFIVNGGDVSKLIEWKSFRLESISDMNAKELMSDEFLQRLYRIKDKMQRTQALIACETRASECGIGRKNFKELWKAFLSKQSGDFVSNKTHFVNAPVVVLESGDWVADMSGVYRLKVNEMQETEREYASSIPITPIAILENQEDGTEKIAVAFHKKNTWKTVNIPKEVLVNSNKIIELATIGADVSSLTAKLLVQYFCDMINLNEGKALPTEKTVSHLGWYGDEFVPYSEEIKTDLERDFTNILNALQDSKGTLDEWVDFIKPLRANKVVRLIICASFASVLVERVNGLSFFVHLFGSTGFGKTLSLMLAASVWGNPGKNGLVFPLNSTLNYVARLAGILKNLPLCADELQMIKTAYGNYDRLIMTLSEGEEKGRLSKEIIARKKGNWNLITITTGEEPIAKYDSGGGAVNRVIEVYCDQPITDDGISVAEFVSEHYGVAGKAFIEMLGDYDVKHMFKQCQKCLLQYDSTSKQVMAMSLLMVADLITCDCIFKDDPLNVEEFAALLKSEQEVDASERAYEALQGLIVENRVNFNFDTENVTESSKLWGCFNYHEIYFVAGILKKEFKKLGYNFDDFKQKWVEKGYIQKYGKDYSKPVRIMHGEKKVRCIIIERGEWV